MSKTKATPAAPSGIVKSGSELSLSIIAAAVNKTVGSEAIRVFGANDRSNVEALPIGNLAIDIATGVGGLPRGRICELYGPESSGKTTFCLAVIAAAQRAGGRCAFIDVEHALAPAHARNCGVEIDDLLLSQPNSGEEALQVAETLLKIPGAVDVIVVDSVAALVPQSELDGEITDATVGAQARLMSKAMRRLTGIVSRTKCVVIFTNQIREKIGVMFGNPETTPGGRALKFFASIRIDIRRRDAIKDANGAMVGFRTRIKLVKNKVARPFTEAEVDLYFSNGIDAESALIDLGVEHKVLEKKGAWISFEGALVGQGRDGARAALKEKADLATRIRDAILKRVSLAQVVEPPPIDPALLEVLHNEETTANPATNAEAEAALV